MSRVKGLSASLEDYIEAIFHIIVANKVARGKEIASRLNVSRASVTEALRALSKRGLINYAPYEVITLTANGRRAAQDVIRRHDILKDFFVKVLAIDDGLAEEGACRIEHAAPPEIIDRLANFVSFVEGFPQGGSDFIREFVEFCKKTKPNQGVLPGMQKG